MKKNQSTIVCLILFLCLVSLSSCYSSTAVKGTPIRELPPGSIEPSRAFTVMTPEQRAQISQMSGVTENAAFMDVKGIPEYRIGPQDVLEISSLVGDKRTTTTLTVNSRGTISYSFLDDVEVAGLTPSQFDDLLTRKLSAYVRNPRIDILVKEFNSKSATIIGELSSLRSTTTGKAQSGRINLEGRTNLMDLIAMAGGYTIDADIKNVKLVRNRKAFLINVYDIIEKGDESQNVIIDDGDVVNIPELPEFGERVYVMGEVNYQGIYALKNAKDLLGAISLAGSFTRLAKEENTLIVRGYGQGQKPLVMMADLNALLRKADLAQNVTLKDRDLVYVPRILIADINDWIANTTPLLDFLYYPYEYETRYSTRRFLQFHRPHH